MREGVVPSRVPSLMTALRYGSLRPVVDLLTGKKVLRDVPQPLRREPRQRRNERCACRSGAKFKNCCGAGR